jgi:hypothetical protein
MTTANAFLRPLNYRDRVIESYSGRGYTVCPRLLCALFYVERGTGRASGLSMSSTNVCNESGGRKNERTCGRRTRQGSVRSLQHMNNDSMATCVGNRTIVSGV